MLNRKEHHGRASAKIGFTLVEMLVSMAILGLIVLLLGRIFTDGSNAYKQGMKSSDQNLNGRVIMDFIARELKQAVVDDNLVIRIQASPVNPYGTGLNDWISFASIGGGGYRQTARREVELIRYYVNVYTRTIGGVNVGTYALKRNKTDRESIINEAYINSDWAGEKGITQQMARNLSGFRIQLYYANDASGYDVKPERDPSTGEAINFQTNALPSFADIYMGLLGDSDLVESHISNDSSLVAKREMIFMKRVYFHNHAGYNSDYGRDLWR